MKTATFVKQLPGWTGDARLFKLSEPVSVDSWSEPDEEIETTEYVVVSAVAAMFSGPETYIFPAYEDGTTISMGELEGSFRGGLDHEEALEGLGFEVIYPKQG